MEFDEEKKEYLKKLYQPDNSKKGEVDKEIVHIIDRLNSKKDYYTTSSCSGRIILITSSNPKKKNTSNWLFVSHTKIRFDDLPLIRLPKNPTWFRQESMILHVACKSIESAQQLIDKAKFAGLKRSGIMATKRRIIVEIVSTEKIDAPIGKNGKLMVSKTYIKYLVSEANNKMDATKEKIEKFYKLI